MAKNEIYNKAIYTIAEWLLEADTEEYADILEDDENLPEGMTRDDVSKAIHLQIKLKPNKYINALAEKINMLLEEEGNDLARDYVYAVAEEIGISSKII